MIIGFGYGFGLCLTASRAGIELLTCVFAGCGFCYFSVIPCVRRCLDISAYLAGVLMIFRCILLP